MAGLIVALLLAAQAATLAFDVASVKPSTALDAGGTMRLMPGGGVTVRNVPVRNLITIAYQIQQFQLVNAPEWTRNARYDVVAKPAAASVRDQIFPMLQALMSDRFKLSIHREQREMDGYSLVQARAGELGPGLKVSSVDCEKAFATTPRCREGGLDFGATNSMRSFGIPIWSLLQTVIGQMGGPVSDETRLTGHDVTLRWSTEVAPTDDAPTFVTALQEQLGLKLERKRVTTDVVVVDHIEHPTPD